MRWRAQLKLDAKFPYFSRMRSRRVPVLKLGSRGPGGDARSLRCVRKASAKRPQAFASVRGGSDMPERRNRRKSSRNVELSSLFYVSPYNSINRNRDRGGRGRETQNCRRFWTRLVSSRLKSVNCHRDRGGRGRETQNCRHCWIRRDERREERGRRGGKRGEERGERREEERREKREEKRERRGERRERRKERGGERGCSHFGSSHLPRSLLGRVPSGTAPWEGGGQCSPGGWTMQRRG